MFAQWQLGKYNYDFGVDGSIAVYHLPLVGIVYSCGGRTNDASRRRSYETILDGFGYMNVCLSPAKHYTLWSHFD